MARKEIRVLCCESTAEIFAFKIIFNMITFSLFSQEFLENFEKTKIIVNPKSIEKKMIVSARNYKGLQYGSNNKSVTLLLSDLEIR